MTNLPFAYWIRVLIAFAITVSASASDAGTIAADDGTTLIVQESTVRVPETRTTKTGTIDLKVVRIGRNATPTRMAHVRCRPWLGVLAEYRAAVLVGAAGLCH